MMDPFTSSLLMPDPKHQTGKNEEPETSWMKCDSDFLPSCLALK